MKRILSVDWDFFSAVQQGEERARLFPDGMRELGRDASCVVWSGYYNVADLEKLVDLKSDEYNALCDFLSDIPNKPIIYFANDHKHIYSVIKDFVKDDNEHIQVWNIDLHSDVYDVGKDVNCGNWGNRILREYPNSTITWVADELEYEHPCELSEEEERRFYTGDYWEALSNEYDVIYVCKSNAFSPPHLDVYYSMLIECVHYAGLSYYKSAGLEDRIAEVKKQAKKSKDFLDKVELLHSTPCSPHGEMLKLSDVIEGLVK